MNQYTLSCDLGRALQYPPLLIFLFSFIRLSEMSEYTQIHRLSTLRRTLNVTHLIIWTLRTNEEIETPAKYSSRYQNIGEDTSLCFSSSYSLSPHSLIIKIKGLSHGNCVLNSQTQPLRSLRRSNELHIDACSAVSFCQGEKKERISLIVETKTIIKLLHRN